MPDIYESRPVLRCSACGPHGGVHVRLLLRALDHDVCLPTAAPSLDTDARSFLSRSVLTARREETIDLLQTCRKEAGARRPLSLSAPTVQRAQLYLNASPEA